MNSRPRSAEGALVHGTVSFTHPGVSVSGHVRLRKATQSPAPMQEQLAPAVRVPVGDPDATAVSTSRDRGPSTYTSSIASAMNLSPL